MANDLINLTLSEAGSLLAAGKLSATELTRAYLERIEKENPDLNAYITVCADSALAEARKTDQLLAKGTRLGPLHGIPVAVKDLIHTAGVRTTAGSRIFHNFVPETNAFVVDRLYEAGAILLGKTNTHEIALGLTNLNPHFGRTKNPWKRAHITGGSSGGSAAAVAAGLAVAALASDTGGSIRVPAAMCGVTGIKPTYGRVSVRGVFPLSWSNDHVGLMARDARDAAILYRALAVHDPNDPFCLSPTDPPVYNSNDPHGPLFLTNKLPVAVPTGYWLKGVDPEIVRAVQDALVVFQSAGATLIEKDIADAEAMFQTNRVILLAEAATVYRNEIENRIDDFGEDVRRRLLKGKATPLSDYALAKRRQVELRRSLERFFEEVDLLVSPTIPFTAPSAENLDAVAFAERVTAFTAPFNLTGAPAISIPCGFSADGLPLGMQLVARPWNEALLLQAAQVYQSNTDWHRRLPVLNNFARSS